MTFHGYHGNNWLFSMIFLLLLFGATFIPNLSSSISLFQDIKAILKEPLNDQSG